MTFPYVLENGVGNYPDANKFMANYDWIFAMAKGNFLAGPGFEQWNGGTSFTNPADAATLSDGWSLSKGGTSAATADITRESTTKDSGSYSMKVNISVAGSSNSYLRIKQSVSNYSRFSGLTMFFGAKVKVGTASKVRLSIYDGVTTAYSSYHTGSGTWEKLTVALACSQSLTELTVKVEITSDFGSDPIYIDSSFLYNIQSTMSSTAREALAYFPPDDPLSLLLGSLTINGTLSLNGSISGNVDNLSARNKIINGNFDIWQRGTSFVSPGSGVYHADRWAYLVNGAAAHTISRSTTVPTVDESRKLSNYSVKVDCTTADASISAGEYTFLQYKMEGYDWAFLAQKTFTLSFWVRSTKTGTFCVGFTNGAQDRSYVAEYTISASDTWEKKTITVTASPSAGTWDYTNGAGLIIWFVIACGSTFQTTAGTWHTGNYQATSNQVNGTDSTANDFYLAQVQVEAGSSASSFEQRPIQTELALCQRYYEKSFDLSTAPAQNLGSTQGAFYMNQVVGASTAQVGNFIQFKVPKRTSPGITLYNTNASNAQARNQSTGSDCSATAANTPSEQGVQISFTSPGGSAAGNQVTIQWSASAEL